MIQQNIENKQNEEFFLKCQYSARYYFNLAEKLNIWVWIICFLTSLTVFITSDSNLITLGLPLILDLVSFILEYNFNKSVKNASDLRNFFDANVLDINPNKYTETKIRHFKSLIEHTINKNILEASTQIKNTGRDNPPGVLNWYEFSRSFTDNEAKFECQRQNCWWNEKLSKYKIRLFFFAIIIFLTITLILKYYFKISFLRIFLSSALLFKIFERIHVYCAYCKTSIQIQGDCEMVEHSMTKENIEFLQTKIEKRRKIKVLNYDFIHKKLAAKLSNQYKNISSL